MLLRTYADETDLVKDASGDDGGRVDPKTLQKWGGCSFNAFPFWRHLSFSGRTAASMTSTTMQ